MISYPKVTVDLTKLGHNVKTIKKICENKGISIAGVVKGCNGIVECAKVMEEKNLPLIATSRINQIRQMKEAGITTPMMLIRIPMISEVADVIELADISLNSEIDIIKALDVEAKRQNKIHKVILMKDLGDLREGFWNSEELVAVAKEVESNLLNIELAGVGTNLGCYGSILATREKMEELVKEAEAVEEAIGRKLEYISGGATSSLLRVVADDMPKRINQLRIGEGILLANDYKDELESVCGKLYQDAFRLDMEVVEIKEKPTYPVGEIARDCFGQAQQYEDRGIRKRAILAGGKIDYGFGEMLIPTEDGITVIGGSSDHTIIDIEDAREIKIGDIVSFDMSYANLAFITKSKDINIEIVR